MQATATLDLWTSMRDGDADAREQLVTEHLGLVYHTVKKMRPGLAPDAEFDELVSAGTLGLMSALDAFDTSRGLAFSTFAIPRIRGAILDELRRLDTRPRLVRRRQREMTQARDHLAAELGHEPTSKEIAKQIGVDMPTLIRWEADGLRGKRLPLDRPFWRSGDGRVSASESSIASSAPSIDDELTHEQEVKAMKCALELLSSQERTVIGLYFEKELKLREIAVVLRLTESRISQIRTSALAKLKNNLAPMRRQVG